MISGCCSDRKSGLYFEAYSSMKKEFSTTDTILRIDQKKIARFFFLFITITFVQSCQSPRYSHNEAARMTHAKELLNSEYASTSAVNFEGDQKFSQYLSEYISAENANLNSDQMTQALVAASAKNHYDPVFLLAVIKTESQFNPRAVGSAGELGLMQIKPDTAEWICQKSGFPWKGANALKDPVYNVQIGALYFKYLKKSLKSRSAYYINAYNMGINNLHRLPASSKISHPYYARVMQNYIGIYQELQKIKKSIKS
jgi:soluble lytic murein transglycosylase